MCLAPSSPPDWVLLSMFNQRDLEAQQGLLGGGVKIKVALPPRTSPVASVTPPLQGP